MKIGFTKNKYNREVVQREFVELLFYKCGSSYCGGLAEIRMGSRVVDGYSRGGDWNSRAL